MRHSNRQPVSTSLAFVAILIWASAVCGQTQTTSFTYQGRLTDGGTPASGNYDLQFALFDNSSSAGTQIGSTLTRSSVLVGGGVFTVQLDFGISAFPGADRFLEIGVRPASVGSFTTLSPRQQISSTPYAIRTLSAATADTATNATQLGGVAASQYVQTTDARLSDGRAPTAGSTNYIQSNPPAQQNGANFNISGNGTAGGTLSAGTVNATTQYNIGGAPMVSAPGDSNTLVGDGAGQENSGARNAFFGTLTGQFNTTGSLNSFFGMGAGRTNFSNSTGDANSFFGYFAGKGNLTGSNNTAIGREASFASGNLTFATAIGAFATVSTDHTIVLGASSEKVIVPGTMQVGFSSNTIPMLRIVSIPPANNTFSGHVCFNPQGDLLNCDQSSLRFKTKVHPYLGGLDIVRRLRPINFTWKANGRRDIGLGAEEVAEVAPAFVTSNDKGEIAGVKYDRLNILLINAVKEQQKEIELQHREITRLKEQVRRLMVSSRGQRKR